MQLSTPWVTSLWSTGCQATSSSDILAKAQWHLCASEAIHGINCRFTEISLRSELSSWFWPVDAWPWATPWETAVDQHLEPCQYTRTGVHMPPMIKFRWTHLGRSPSCSLCQDASPKYRNVLFFRSKLVSVCGCAMVFGDVALSETEPFVVSRQIVYSVDKCDYSSLL